MRKPEEISAQMSEVLARLKDDPMVWVSLAFRFTIDFFCGLFMASSNNGLVFAPELLTELGRRGIALSLDIDDAGDDRDS